MGCQTIGSALFIGWRWLFSTRCLSKTERKKIMKLLLFEDRGSNSLHPLLLRSVFSASDRLREKTDKRDALV